MERWIDNAPQGECPVCRTPVDKLVPVRKMDEVRGSQTLTKVEVRCRSAEPCPSCGHERVLRVRRYDRIAVSKEGSLNQTGIWFSYEPSPVSSIVRKFANATLFGADAPLAILSFKNRSGGEMTRPSHLQHSRLAQFWPPENLSCFPR